MHTGTSAFSILLLTPAFGLASADDDTFESPWNYNSREYDVNDTFTQPPNATGQFSIPSVDLTKPWAGHDSFGDDWNIYAAAFAGLPASENTVSFPTNQWLRVPEDSFEEDEIDHAWSVCYYPLSSFKWFRESLEEAQDDPDGDCAGTIPQQCIDELLARTNSLGGCDDNWNSGPSINSCDGVTAWGLYDFIVSPWDQLDIVDELSNRTSSDNGTAIPLFGKILPYARADNQTMRDEVYDRAISDVIPYLISYKYQRRDMVESHSVFRCIRANNVADGSREPESVGGLPSGGTSLGIPIMVVGLVFILTLCF